MLHFFRKYQSYFFAITTFVIIISFSFFGTYKALPGQATRDQVAFTTVNGDEIRRHELDEMVIFLSTDDEDKRLMGGVWGPNFLNDGFIKKDLLATGLADVLVEAFPELVEEELQQRLEKEKHYSLYVHPEAKFLGTEGAWAYFAPNLKGQFDILKNANTGIAPEAFAARVNLFLGEKQFPSQMLRQVLRYQQKQYTWLIPDPNLEHLDLSLFGYHTIENWFGPRFLRMVAEFVINSSKIAEQKGYKVTKEEALADLRRNSEISFQANLKNPYLGVANSSEYFNEQLRYLGMDQTQATKVWSQVLLSRRLFHDVGNAVLTDPLAHQQFFSYAQEAISGNLYRLPEDLRFGNYRELQKFEVYLDAVASRNKNSDQALLTLPATFRTVAEIKKQHPELVQKSYLLQVAQTNKKALQAKVALKEMWSWEADDQNWNLLKTEFPELGIAKGATREERFEALDNLDNRTRSRVDAVARAAVVDKHPEWLEQALQEAETQKIIVGIRPIGGSSFVAGLDNRKELIRLLDQAPLGDQEKGALAQFTGDKDTYYRIVVLERAPDEEILTFAEANQAKVLDKILDNQLEAYYSKLQEGSSAEFQKEDKSWKPFADVKSLVADRYFEKLLKAIRKDYMETSEKESPQTGDWTASVRFYTHVRDIQKKLMQKGVDTTAWVRLTDKNSFSNDHLAVRQPLEDQWKLEETPYEANRSEENSNPDLDHQELFALTQDEWTLVHTPINGDLYFFQLKGRDTSGDVAVVSERVDEAHQLLSDDAQRRFMHQVVREIKDKHAISLEYLDRTVESIEPEVSEVPSPQDM